MGRAPILAADGKALIVAIDHARAYGAIEGLEDPGAVIRASIEGGAGAAGVFADGPSALEALRYDEYPIEPVPEEVAFYEDAFRKVYGRLYPSLRNVHHEIERLQPGE